MAHNSQQLRKFSPTEETDKEGETDSVNKGQNGSKELTEEVQKDIEMDLGEPEGGSKPSTARLDQLDVSFLAEKRIEPIKQRNKGERLKELREIGTQEEKKNQDLVERVTKLERHIRLMDGFEDYLLEDLVDKVADTEVGTKLVHLLDLFPKFRSAFQQKLKLTPRTTSKVTNKETVVTNAVNRLSEKKISKVYGQVEGQDGEIFLDSCASINMITQAALKKYQINKEPVGSITEMILQAYTNTTMSADIYELEISIGPIAFKDYFRVIEKDDLFEILIGVDSLKKHKLILNFTDDTLYTVDENNQPLKLAPIYYDLRLSNKEENTRKKDEVVEVDISKPVNITVSLLTTTEEQPETKEARVEKILKVIPDFVKDPVTKLFENFKEVLAIKTDDLKPTKLLPHRIVLKPGSTPVKQRAYRLSKVQALALKKELEKLISNKLIEPSHSPWSSPVVLVLKKNGQYRMCVDYRRVNSLTEKDAYALPLIDDILSYIGRNQVLSTIDLFLGYHQVPMFPEDQEITCFTTLFGNYNFRVMPFRLCNAPATFQREMNRIFFNLIGKCVFIYIDDLVVFSPSYEQHAKDLAEVFSILKKNGLKLNLEKCHFFQEEVELLGHILSTKGIKPIPEKVKIIANWLPPKDVSKLTSFLGAVGYYRKFIKDFAQIAKPLFKLLKKNTKFEWTTEADLAFITLKDRLINAPILVPPDFKKPFIIRTDASRNGIGGVIMQRDEKGVEKPIHYISRSLKTSENNYSVTDLEGTAALYCVKKFKHYILGNQSDTTLITDHKPLVGICNNTEPANNRHLKWVTLLSALKVKVLFEEGKKNVIADALSRMETRNEIEDSDNEDYEAVLLLQSIEDFINRRIVVLEGKKYYKHDGRLRRIVEDQKERFQLIEAAHSVGHEGIYKTYHRLKPNYYWKGMNKEIGLYIKCCPKCQMYKRQKQNENVENIPTKPGYPFSRVGLDLVGPLPRTKAGNKFIIVLVDYLTKWVEAEPLKETGSDEVVKFLKKVFARHGTPEILVTDNGPQFYSDKTKAFLDLHDVYVSYATTYHPSTNGEVENRNKEIVKYLKLLASQEEEWDELLPSALWALRTCKNERTKFSSFELLYGRRDSQPLELMLNKERRNKYEKEEEYWMQKFIQHHKWIKEAINNIETANKLWSDRRKQIRRMRAEYKPGDLVLVRVFNRRKLDPYFTGPLKIVKKELNTITVCDPISGEIAERNIHLKNVIPYFSEI